MKTVPKGELVERLDVSVTLKGEDLDIIMVVDKQGVACGSFKEQGDTSALDVALAYIDDWIKAAESDVPFEKGELRKINPYVHTYTVGNIIHYLTKETLR